METKTENFILKIFDTTIEALGLITKKLSDSIENNKLSKRSYIALHILNGLLQNEMVTNGIITSNDIHCTEIVSIAYKVADEFLKEENY